MKPEATIAHIVNWLKDYSEKSGTKGFVVGVSGGIDSAVTASLAARTGKPTLLVEMPIHQAPSQVNRAQEQMKALEQQFDNVRLQRTDLTSIFDDFVAEVPDASEEPNRDLSLANTRARLRMTTLYYYAGLYSYLVAGTGNKVEDFGVGFYTKYGDGGVDLSPIADLVKSEVYALGKALNVIEDIQQAAPTDGLFGDDRSDEDQLGASYDELEWAMKMDEQGKSAEAFEGRQQEVMKIYIRLNRSNRHKMNSIPVCIIPESCR